MHKWIKYIKKTCLKYLHEIPGTRRWMDGIWKGQNLVYICLNEIWTRKQGGHHIENFQGYILCQILWSLGDAWGIIISEVAGEKCKRGKLWKGEMWKEENCMKSGANGVFGLWDLKKEFQYIVIRNSQDIQVKIFLSNTAYLLVYICTV